MNLTVNIKDFGAVENVSLLQTQNIQSAIDHCFEKGGGTVVIPSGTFITGDIRLRSNVTLYLSQNAILKGSTDPEDYFNYLNDKIQPLTKEQITNAPYTHDITVLYKTEYVEDDPDYKCKRTPGSRWNNAIIRAIDAQNIKIIGEAGSVIDGSNCFDELGEEHFRGPHGMTLFNCNDITLCGYTIQNTGNWAHNLLFCQNISVENITALAGHDGFDASVCNNLTIKNSSFFTGDDCVAGFGNVNVLVSGCVLNSACSAMRFGGRNVYVEKCNIYGPGKYSFRGCLTDEQKRNMVPSPTVTGRNNMLSAFTYYASFSLPINTPPGNIVISDCTITNADRFLHYNYSGNEIWQRNKPLCNIEFKNIKATGVSMPLTAYGDSNTKIDLTLENVSISLREGYEDIDLLHICNYKNVTLNNVSVQNLKKPHAIRAWSKGNISVENCTGFDTENAVVYTNEDFNCDII